jgi:adenylylsulfate reductase, subunit A
MYQTNAKMLDVVEHKLNMLKEDSKKLRAKDLHELLRVWENYYCILIAKAHMKPEILCIRNDANKFRIF